MPPAHTPQSSTNNSSGEILKQNGSWSNELSTQTSNTLSKHNDTASPLPNPSPSASYQYSKGAGLKQPQPILSEFSL